MRAPQHAGGILPLATIPTHGTLTGVTPREQEIFHQLQLLHSQAETSFLNLNINLLRDFCRIIDRPLRWHKDRYFSSVKKMTSDPFFKGIEIDDFVKLMRVEIAAGAYNICKDASVDVSLQLNTNELITLYAYYKASTEVLNGIHEGFGLNNDDMVMRFLNKPYSQTTPIPQDTFPYFNSLPAEVRLMIWKEAVRGQDRVVWIDRFRKITKAPCPTLFLVCSESLIAAQEVYKKVRGGDILKGRIMPSYYAWEGPIISFEHDILMIENWHRWRRNRKSMTSRNARNRLLAGRPLRPMQKRIAEMGKLGISRVAFCETELEHRMPEMVFYKNARKYYTQVDRATDERDEWAWAWTEHVKEVLILYRTNIQGRTEKREHLCRMFPPRPNSDCACSVCTTWLTEKNPFYQRPDPQDVASHERLFDAYNMGPRLPFNVPTPQLAYQPNPFNYMPVLWYW